MKRSNKMLHAEKAVVYSLKTLLCCNLNSKNPFQIRVNGENKRNCKIAFLITINKS